MHGDTLDSDKAIQAVENACYQIVDDINDKGIFLDFDKAPEGIEDDYNSLLKRTVRQYFPGIDGEVNGAEIGKMLENVVHWIIFGAGVEICNERYPNIDGGRGWSIVRTDKFKPDLIETGINNYGDHIRNLAGFMP